MKSLITSTFIAVSSVVMFSPSLVQAKVVSDCAATVKNCGPDIDNVDYQGGGVEVVTRSRTACFPKDLTQDIVLSDGSYGFVAAFVYKPNGVNLEQIKDVTGQYDYSGDRICWNHNVSDGTMMAVYVTCRTYTGWVAVEAGDPGATRVLQMVPQDWKFLPPWL